MSEDVLGGYNVTQKAPRLIQVVQNGIMSYVKHDMDK